MASLGKWALGCNCRGKPLNKRGWRGEGSEAVVWWWVGVGSDAQSDISFEVCSRFELSLFKTDLVDLND
jgi:hypothetical protein